LTAKEQSPGKGSASFSQSVVKERRDRGRVRGLCQTGQGGKTRSFSKKPRGRRQTTKADQALECACPGPGRPLAQGGSGEGGGKRGRKGGGGGGVVKGGEGGGDGGEWGEEKEGEEKWR